jgi:hypothetical protein
VSDDRPAKEKPRFLGGFKLPGWDSNQDKENQNAIHGVRLCTLSVAFAMNSLASSSSSSVVFQARDYKSGLQNDDAFLSRLPARSRDLLDSRRGDDEPVTLTPNQIAALDTTSETPLAYPYTSAVFAELIPPRVG